jgi:pyruvate formate lyase activating enzyme
MIGRETSARELLVEVLKDRVFFDQSGGGVTLSGGEPLMQPAFAGDLMKGLKTEGVHVALDTCGFGAQVDLIAMSAYADLVLFDLKLADAKRHEAATGEGNERILANLKALGEAGGVIWLRVPIIPGINDDDANLEATARIAAATPGVRRVDLLPYHGTAEAKFERMGASYPLRGLEAPGPERMIQRAGIFKSFGLEVNIGGRP